MSAKRDAFQSISFSFRPISAKGFSFRIKEFFIKDN